VGRRRRRRASSSEEGREREHPPLPPSIAEESAAVEAPSSPILSSRWLPPAMRISWEGTVAAFPAATSAGQATLSLWSSLVRAPGPKCGLFVAHVVDVSAAPPSTFAKAVCGRAVSPAEECVPSLALLAPTNEEEKGDSFSS